MPEAASSKMVVLFTVLLLSQTCGPQFSFDIGIGLLERHDLGSLARAALLPAV
jgi:hypothetical protein